jgi:hypothetical protein
MERLEALVEPSDAAIVTANLKSWKERRSEPRIEARASVVMTPLAAVATRLNGSVVNVSARGVRVHVPTQFKQLPRVGEIFRIQGRDDLILGEVRHAEAEEAGTVFGLQIVHWGNTGELRRLVQNDA